ncbi:unnamed protein product, partial [Staurois parvus]
PAVSPVSASQQCHLSVLPSSATCQCPSVAAYQCIISASSTMPTMPASSVLPICAASSMPISAAYSWNLTNAHQRRNITCLQNFIIEAKKTFYVFNFLLFFHL